MLTKFANFLDRHLSAPMIKLSEQRHLQAIRDGIISTLPLIIVGSFFLVIAFLPFPEGSSIKIWLTANAGNILLPYRMTMFIMSLYISWGIGYSLAKSYKVDAVSGAMLAAASFLLTLTPKVLDGFGWAMPMANLGGSGMFVAIIVSILSGEIFRLIAKSKFKITMPEGVPSSVARSFEAITPAIIIVLLMGIITYMLKFDWHGTIAKLVGPIVDAADSLPSVLIIVFLVTFFWSFGIHGVSIIGSLARPIWTQILETNSAAYAAGQTVDSIAAEPFFQWFIWIGGSGATIGLAILLAFASKSAYGKALGKTSIIPAIFNINEPIIFGAPIVMNPILIIPFIITPMVLATIAWFATKIGLIAKVVVLAPWTLPGPLGAYFATGGDWKAFVFCIILIVISIFIYFPFFKIYDKFQVAEEHKKEMEKKEKEKLATAN